MIVFRLAFVSDCCQGLMLTDATQLIDSCWSGAVSALAVQLLNHTEVP